MAESKTKTSKCDVCDNTFPTEDPDILVLRDEYKTEGHITPDGRDID